MLEKNEVLVEPEQGLTDYEIATTRRNSNVMNHYQSRNVVVMETLTMEFATQLERG